MQSLSSFRKYINLKVLFVSFIFWVPFIIFLKLAGEVIEKEPLPFDVAILQWFHSYASPALDAFFITLTNIGGIVGVIVVTGALVGFYIYKHRRRDALFLFTSVTGATAANLVLKAAFHRDRPSLWHQSVVEQSFSFPSGHAMASAALVACLICIYWYTPKRYLTVVIGGLFVLLIGMSRLYLGVHYPSDILGGWLVSSMWVFVCFIATIKSTRRKVDDVKRN